MAWLCHVEAAGLSESETCGGAQARQSRGADAGWVRRWSGRAGCRRRRSSGTAWPGRCRAILAASTLLPSDCRSATQDLLELELLEPAEVTPGGLAADVFGKVTELPRRSARPAATSPAMTFCSWRTLPGQSSRRSAWSASGAIRRAAAPPVANRRENSSTSALMSSGRSRSGGRAMRTTNRSTSGWRRASTRRMGHGAGHQPWRFPAALAVEQARDGAGGGAVEQGEVVQEHRAAGPVRSSRRRRSQMSAPSTPMRAASCTRNGPSVPLRLWA